MYNIKFSDYIPEPTPASSDRIIAAHYYAAWKKGAAGIHEGFDDLAEEYPDRTPLMGYYDEENPEVADWEIKWAVEHGINCFIHCWYRKPENFGKPVTVEDLRCGHALHEAFFHARFQKYMKFAIMFEASPRWCGTNSTDMLEHLMPFWMENYFKRENYLVIDNKPVLFVFNQWRLASECFESVEEQRSTFDACREYARSSGFDGMIFAVCDYSEEKQAHDELMARGYDFRFGYGAAYQPPYSYYENEDEIARAQCEIIKKRLEVDPTKYLITPSCFWDPTPRFTKRWIDLGYTFHQTNVWHLSPEKYKGMIKKMKEISDSLPPDAWGRRIVMIDNWNEWDEGHFVAPSHKFGYKYLQAIREVFTACDNLPDYRTPHDQGFGGYNKSWKEPDFSAFCEKALKNKEHE